MSSRFRVLSLEFWVQNAGSESGPTCLRKWLVRIANAQSRETPVPENAGVFLFLGGLTGYPLQVLGHFVPHGLWAFHFYPYRKVPGFNIGSNILFLELNFIGRGSGSFG